LLATVNKICSFVRSFDFYCNYNCNCTSISSIVDGWVDRFRVADLTIYWLKICVFVGFIHPGLVRSLR